ncbi:MAG: carboxypeptidase-like regulatory domain-containing protein [Nitrospirae bacterium]|nr:carboxypeptidase-like regulatory domain-containing protein [Nitrospirota bacterium]MBI3393446.1 carboxypeptidase-like regulatory domain-containing protein [Nitrospirota bacterium]
MRTDNALRTFLRNGAALVMLILLTLGCSGKGGSNPAGPSGDDGSSAGKVAVSGQVADTNNAVVEGATVEVHSNPVSTTTGSDGKWSVQVEPGDHTIYVFLNGVEVFKATFTLSSDGKISNVKTVSAGNASSSGSSLDVKPDAKACEEAKKKTSVNDKEPPTAPTGLSATPYLSPFKVVLTWNASSDNVGVAGYNVYRNGSLIGTASKSFAGKPGGSSKSYYDYSISANTTYTYEVAAFDSAGNVSAKSNAATATTGQQDTQAPTAPSNLSAEVVTSPSKKVNLNWTGSTDNVGVAGYKIYRNGSLIGTSSSTSYTDSSVSAGATYSYEVAAYDDCYNISGHSNSVSATIPSS